MINPEDDVIVDLSTSCTLQEAVIKLLGWSRGPLLRRVVRITDKGISEDQMPYIHAENISLPEQLQNMRDAAQQELIDAVSIGESSDVLTAREAAVFRCDDLIKKAYNYNLDISHELHKKELSELDLDTELSKETGVIHITLRSLDQWGKRKYGFSILTPSFSSSNVSVDNVSDGIDALDDSKKSLVPGENESLAVTFAFLVEAYAKKHKMALMRDDVKINVSAFSKELFDIIQGATDNNPPRGQGEESIRKRIDESIRIKDRKLRSR